MARTEVTKTIVENVTTITCDVCGGKVNNYWHMTSYYNGVNYEYTCPLDLCEDHEWYYEHYLTHLDI